MVNISANYSDLLNSIPETRHITDLEIFNQYCHNYVELLPLYSFIILFIAASIYIFVLPEKYQVNEHITRSILFLGWCLAFINVLVHFFIYFKITYTP